MFIILRKVSFYLALAGIMAAVLLIRQLAAEAPTPKPAFAPAKNPYSESISASGLVEAKNENIHIGVPEGGLITALLVNVGDSVVVDQPLLQLDDRDLQAERGVAQANVAVAQATLKQAEDLLKRVQAVDDARAVSAEERTSRENDVKVARAQVAAARATVQRLDKLIERRLIRAPKDGVILQANARAGEYVTVNGEAPIILGNLSVFHVRADFDEQNATRLDATKPAVAYAKGHNDIALPLRFVRVEPLVVPKRALTGATNERVDTRVLQVIYEFDRPPNLTIYVGQQMDIFVQAEAIKDNTIKPIVTP